MNKRNIILTVLTVVMLPFSTYAADMSSYMHMVEESGPTQAMALANQWKWTQEGITSHVTPDEVVFEFPDGAVKKVALPQDKMVVAIAPYLTYTHG